MSEPPPRWRAVDFKEITHSIKINTDHLQEHEPNMTAAVNSNFNKSLLDFRQANLALSQKVQQETGIHSSNVGDLLHAATVSTIDLGIQQVERLDHGNFTQHLVLIGGPSSSPTANESTDEINSFYFYKTEQFTIMWMLFVMIVIGNSAVLITLTFNKSRKSRMNFFIKQLAIADLTVGLISVLTDIIWRMTIAWYAGNIACKVIRFLQAIVTYSSTYVLVALSIDRYDAITHPMNFTGSWRRARVLVISAWIISIIFSIPELFLFEERHIEGHLQCWIELQPWQWRVYMTVITFILLVVPAVIISACYTVIVRTIWSKSKLLVPPPLPAVHLPPGDAEQYQQSHGRRKYSYAASRTAVQRYDDYDTRRVSSRGIIPKAKIKTVKMTFVIVFAFILCWSPYIVFDLLQVYGQIPKTQTTTAIATLIQSLAPLNSAANPLIYCLFSARTCRTLRRSTTTTTHTIRVQTNAAAVNSRHCKVGISVV